MCGIVGWYKENHCSRDKRIIKKMTSALRYRGPDSVGYFMDDNILLGHRRLSIIDVLNGKQPMSYNGYTIVYNGEIYNVDEIKKRLKKYSFDTNSDTEVLLKGYIEYKEKILDMIDGIYAFAIYKDGKLFLARDPFGVKPLFYTNVDGFLFASEIKALFKNKNVKPIINSRSLQELLSFSPSRVLGSGVFKDIYELRAGHYLIYENDKIDVKRYWNVVDKKCNDSFDDAVKKVRKILTNSIKRQMVSDVDVSCLLSGGLDSSIITAIVAKNKKKLDTYSIDYEGNEKYFNKSLFTVSQDNDFIRIMSKKFKTNHHFEVISQRTLARYLKDSVCARDLPGMADIDSSLLWFSKKISKHHKVILSGECADEIFGGYPWFYRDDVNGRECFPWLDNVSLRSDLLRKDLKDKLNLKEFVKSKYDEVLCEIDTSDKIKQLFYLNMVYFMPTLLERKDRMTMRAGIEARVPFANVELVEYLWNLPWDYKYSNNIEKFLLRKAFEDILPNEVAYRKKNPYPKTHNPRYTKIVIKLLKRSLKNKKSILYKIFDKDRLFSLIESEGKSFNEPWFGQLMSGPQLLAFLYQIDFWAKKYKIILDL